MDTTSAGTTSLGSSFDHTREAHFGRLQKTLEEALTAIAAARTTAEADAARQFARIRLDELNHVWRESLPREQVV